MLWTAWIASSSTKTATQAPEALEVDHETDSGKNDRHAVPPRVRDGCAGCCMRRWTETLAARIVARLLRDNSSSV